MQHIIYFYDGSKMIHESSQRLGTNEKNTVSTAVSHSTVGYSGSYHSSLAYDMFKK